MCAEKCTTIKMLGNASCEVALIGNEIAAPVECVRTSCATYKLRIGYYELNLRAFDLSMCVN